MLPLEGGRYSELVGSDQAPDEDIADLEAAGEDREQVLARVFDRHRRRLERMVEIRMHPAVRGRIGVSDVLQEAFLEVSGRLGDYLADPSLPFFLWLRVLTAQKLIAEHRRHLGAQKRDVRRQVSRGRPGFPEATSVVLVEHLVGGGTTPTQAAVRAELRVQLEEALDQMKPSDREVLVLRHFEELTNVEAARELGIERAAASKRYVRAVQRLGALLEKLGLRELRAEP